MKFLLIASLFIFAKCNHNGKFVTGGPCTYDTTKFKAVVVEIIPIKGNTPDSVFSVKIILSDSHSNSKDTLLLSHMTRNELNSGFINRHGIKIGKTLTGTAYFITSGTCNPEMYEFDEPGIGN